MHVDDSVLLEFDMFVIVITSYAFHAYWKAEKVSVLGRHELIFGSSSRWLCPVGHDEV